MIFMPRIDLWAIETFNEVDQKENNSALAHPESSEELCTVMDDQNVEKENQSCQKPCELSEIAVTRDASQKMSHIWSLFVEQVESICVSTSLMILVRLHIFFIFFLFILFH